VVRVEEIIKEEQNDAEETIKLRVSDSSSILFEVNLTQSLLPENIEEGSIIRIKSLIASKSNQKHVLDSVPHTSILLISPYFKISSDFT